MSAEELQRFSKDLEANEDLRNEVQKVGTDADAIVKLAQSKGYDVNKQDLEQAKAGSDQLSDTDLEKAAGGSYYIINPDFAILNK